MPTPAATITVSRLPHRAVLCAVALVTGLASPALAQSPLRTLPGLTEVAVYEATSTVTRNAFAPTSPQLATRLSVLNDSSRDFSHYAGENYDVYFSDADGTPNLSGAFLTIEGTWTGSQNDGSMNVTGAELFIGGQRLLANTVESFRLGGRCAGSACNANSRLLAVDGDLTFSTIPRLGATNPSDPADRIRLTLGFPRPAGSPLTLQPVAPVAPGGTLALAWNNIGAATYTLGAISGPGITTPLVLGTFPCCGTSVQVPPSIPLGTYQVAVSAGGVVSAAIEVVVRFNFAPPVLAPVAPVSHGGLLTFIWTPNPATLYDLMVLSGPGVSGPYRVGQAACCIITLPIDRRIPPGAYTAVIVGAGVQSNVVSFQILGSSTQPLELGATSTIVRPGLQTTLSWTDRGVNAGPLYGIFAGPAGAPSLSLVATQQCCVMAVPWGSVPVGSYDVYVQDSNGVRSNRVTIRFDPQ